MGNHFPCRFFIMLIFGGWCSIIQSVAQEKQIVMLNEHFYPLADENSDASFYKAILMTVDDSTSIETIFTLQNQLIKRSHFRWNNDYSFPEEITNIYDQKGQISSQTIKNRNNGLYQTAYYENNELIGEVLYKGDKQYEIRLAGEEDYILSDQNLLDPKPTFDQEQWQKHLVKHLTYPIQARRSGESGTVIVAYFINEFGERSGPVIANPDHVSPTLAKESLRMARKFDGKIAPATTMDGSTIDAWLYIPVRFILS